MSTVTKRMRHRGSGDELRGASLRLTVQFTALVLVLLAVVGGIVFAIVNNGIADSNERILQAAAQVDSARDAPDGTYITIVDGHSGGQLATPPNLPEGLLDQDAIQSVAAGGADERSERTVAGHTYLLLTTSSTGDRNHDRVTQVALDEQQSSEEIGRLLTALLVGGAVAVVLAFIGSYLMAQRAIRPLADALALQRRFVADASHELRTPLTLLSTRAQLLKRRGAAGLPDDVSTSIDEIIIDTRALTEILDDLLIAADPRSTVEPTPVDLTAIADEVVALLRDEATGRRISLARTGDTGPVTVIGSRAALVRLVVALATNALDHARNSVTISVAATGGSAVVRVVDDGPGFAPDIAKTAFDRFASSRSPAAPDDAGGARHYGLGLAIVAEITARHHGTVTIDTAYRSGAAVVCTLPLGSGPAR